MAPKKRPPKKTAGKKQAVSKKAAPNKAAGKRTMGNFRKKFGNQTKQLKKRHEEAAKRKEERKSGVFLYDKMPEGITEWRPGIGQHEIEIIPFPAGCQNPVDQEGTLSICVDYKLYSNVGATNKRFVSMFDTWEEADPINEYINGGERLKKAEWNKLRSRRRTAFLVWVKDGGKEEAKGIQFWDVAYFFMLEQLIAISTLPRGGGYIPYTDPDIGKTVIFTISKGSFETADGQTVPSQKFSGHYFVDREGPIPDEILDQTFSLDESMHMKPSYEEVYEAFWGEKYDENASDAEEEYEEEEEYEDEEEEYEDEYEDEGEYEEEEGEYEEDPEPEEEEEEESESEDPEDDIPDEKIAKNTEPPKKKLAKKKVRKLKRRK